MRDYIIGKWDCIEIKLNIHKISPFQKWMTEYMSITLCYIEVEILVWNKKLFSRKYWFQIHFKVTDKLNKGIITL